MVPEGWVKTSLSEKIEIKHGFAFKSEYFSDSGHYILMTPGNFYESGGFRAQERKTKYYSGEIPENYILKKRDVLLAMTEQAAGLLGSAALVPESNKYLHNQRLGLVKAKKNSGINIDFIYHLYNSNPIRKQIAEKASGTKVKHTSPEKLASVITLLPPENEQKKIADILFTWDEAIRATEELLSSSQLQKKALMQKLLGDATNPQQTTSTKNLKKLHDIADRIQRKSDGNSHSILTISSLKGFVRQDEKYSRFMAGKSVDNYILLNHGEFAYNKGNSKSYEFGCIFDLEGFDSGLVPHVYICFKLKPGFSHRFFKYLFEADYLKPQLGRLVNTGVRNNGLLNIKPSDFMNTKVPVPPLKEQEKIADILHASTDEITHLRKKLSCLKQEKSALMQQLLTGKIRVKVEAA